YISSHHVPNKHTNTLYVSSVTHQNLHSFPTRRSSDLRRARPLLTRSRACTARSPESRCPNRTADSFTIATTAASCDGEGVCGSRSEEHTSELQSPYDIVCRLLLEKKKIIII